MPADNGGDGLWTPGASGSEVNKGSWYFIDANRRYRGPVTKETLHFLYSTKAITPNTYVFSEDQPNDSGSRAWTRIRKMPELSEELQQPLPAGDDLPADEQDPQSSAAASGTGTAAASCSNSNGGAQGGPTGGTAAPLAADSPMVATPRATVTMVPQTMKMAQDGVKLSTYFTAGGAAGASSTSKKSGGFFKRGEKKPGKYAFGQPITGVPLSADGVPEALTALQEALASGEGEKVEGIFRVSPASSQLKVCRTLAEAGKYKEISDMESVAHLIKLWFRELPESIFAPVLGPIVDGTLEERAQCVELCGRLPELNQKIIHWLLGLITMICRHEADNRMTAQGLVIVFAPNLVPPPATMDPRLCLELNKRVVQFLELTFEAHNASRGQDGVAGGAAG